MTVVKGYDINVRPKNILRRLVKDYLPYWQASTPSFEIIITKIEEEAEEEKEFKWFMIYSDGSFTENSITIPKMKKGENITYKTSRILLGVSGDAKLRVDRNLAVGTNPPTRFITLYVFHVTPRAWISLVIIAGILAGIINAVCQLLMKSNS